MLRSRTVGSEYIDEAARAREEHLRRLAAEKACVTLAASSRASRVGARLPSRTLRRQGAGAEPTGNWAGPSEHGALLNNL